MRLLIAEKNAVAKPLAAVLGNVKAQSGYYDCGEDCVTWAIGHILALCDPEDYDERYRQWSMDDLPVVHREQRLKPIPSKQKQLDTILTLLKRADSVVHVGDPDDEGQLLIDEILDYGRYQGPVSRLMMADIIPANIKKALGNLRDNAEFALLSSAAKARSYGDQLYGYNLTRALTLTARKQGYDGVLSVGRVQTPILGLVVRRDLSHESHTKQLYYMIAGDFAVGDHAIKAKLITPENAKIDSEGRLNDPAYCDEIKTACKGLAATVVTTETKRQVIEPPLPYNLLLLQAEASDRFGHSAATTKEITQALRDKHGLITYNRSNVCYLMDEHHGEAPAVLESVFKNLPDFDSSLIDTSIKSKAFNSKHVDVHHGIIPTIGQPNMTALSLGERQVYELICRRYVMQFVPAAEYDQYALTIKVGDYRFKASCRELITLGWQALKGTGAAKSEDSDDKDEEAVGNWSAIEEGQSGTCNAITVKACETQPPKRYTEKTLLLDLTQVAKYVEDERIKALLKAKDTGLKNEHGGIGTPATRDTMIESLLARGFIERQKKQLVSTKRGPRVDQGTA